MCFLPSFRPTYLPRHTIISIELRAFLASLVVRTQTRVGFSGQSAIHLQCRASIEQRRCIYLTISTSMYTATWAGESLELERRWWWPHPSKKCVVSSHNTQHTIQSALMFQVQTQPLLDGSINHHVSRQGTGDSHTGHIAWLSAVTTWGRRFLNYKQTHRYNETASAKVNQQATTSHHVNSVKSQRIKMRISY